MSITSNLFLTVFTPILILFVLIFRKHINRHNIFLFCMNIVFLLFGGIGGVALLAVTCVLDYFLIGWIHKFNPSTKSRIIFAVAIILNVLPLLLFKYTGFFLNTVNSIFSLSIVIPQWTVPLGISFYTFQAISLLSDVKTGKIKDRPKFFEVCFYLSFFITITSGPIVRFEDICSQLAQRRVSATDFNKGITRFVIGLSKKVLLANTLSLFVENTFSYAESGESLSVLTYWAGSIAFTLQLCLDFSGYSDMAIGLAQVIGFHIPENFDYPYTSRTIGEFWRKWHISLSRWFRDYIYIPLGGNRVSVPRHIFNLFVVWCLTGIWHGANWTFIIWGLLYFVLLVFEKYCKKVYRFFEKHFIGHFYTLFFVNLLWVFFRASSLKDALAFVGGMFGVNSAANPIELSTLHTIPFLILSFLCCMPILRKAQRFNGKVLFDILKAIVLCALLILSIISISGTSFTPFIYGKF